MGRIEIDLTKADVYDREVLTLLTDGGFEKLISQYKVISRKLDEYSKLNKELKQRIAELESEERAKPMRIEFHADNGEMLTPLEVANALINHDAFKVDELKELAEHLQVYCRHYSNRDVGQISF